MVTNNRNLLWQICWGIQICGTLFILLGCAPINNQIEPPISSDPDPADLMILNAVTSVSENIRNMAGKDIPLSTAAPAATKPKENRLIDIEWNGPLETLLLLLSQTYERQFKILGTPPMVPVMINFSRTSYTLDETVKAINQHESLPNWVRLTMNSTEINLVYVTQ